MPEYHFTGTIVVQGVDFYITAPSLPEAMVRVAQGKFDKVDRNTGSIDDWEIDVNSGTKNI